MVRFKYKVHQLLLLAVLLHVSRPEGNGLEITTAQGKLRGDQHDGYISFRGVPYGTISNSTVHGFWRIGPAPTWSGVRTSQRISCQEDRPDNCLNLDIHVPVTGSSIRPIFVLAVHFDANLHPEKLVKLDINVVVLSYRTGAAGFICTKDKRVPGNTGLYDLVTGLRWVRDNAAAFKGNPARVVVGGQGFSAGLVEALTLIPAAKGLFHAIILQSGSILSPVSFNYDAFKRADTLAKTIDKSNKGTAEVVLANYRNLWDDSFNMKFSYYPFALCMQQSSFDSALFTEPPIHLLKNKKLNSVPMMIGYNSQEGYIFAKTLKSSSMVTLLPQELKFRNDREAEQVSKRIEDTYFSNGKALKDMVEYFGDLVFTNHVYRSARLHARSSTPVFLYQFSFASELGVMSVPELSKSGAAHSDEVPYVYGGNQTGEEGVVQSRLVALWANFVKYSNPTPSKSGLIQWSALNPDDPRVMDIGSDLKMTPFPRSRQTAMWDDIMDSYYYGRYQT